MIQITKEAALDESIKIVHAMELLNLVPETQSLSKQAFVDSVSACHQIIDSQFAQPDDMVKDLIDKDPDSLRTYQQMIRYLSEDLRHTTFRGFTTSKINRKVKPLARRVMARSEAFGKIIREARPNHVRLSVHASSGAAKLSFPLIPQPDGALLRVPWMSSIAVTLQGKYLTVRSRDVEDTHYLVHKDGRPWCYMERPAVFRGKV